ncbi:MAG: tRNA (adenine-N1)-methyltransferase [Candidatus Njordarchaeales archaeon]
MSERKEHIFKEGDLVLLLPLTRTKKEERIVIKLKSGDILHTRFGVIKHDDIINTRVGGIVKSHLGMSFIVFPATLPDIVWNYNDFDYVTQIIYPRDWGIIITFADIKSVDKVVEIGTGSGALTAFLAFRLCKEKARLISYERDPERAKRAKKNLERLNVPKIYEIKVRDVAKEGIDEKDVDVVFIDIPEPWTVLKTVWYALKPGGRVIIYVPTYNQVEKTLRALIRNGYIDIRIKENIVRDIQPKPYAIRPELKGYYFSAFIIFARKSLVVPLWAIQDLMK